MGLSLSASIGVMIGSGITFGYFALAASSGSWDPRNFDFSSPGTWNALLGGIATSAFIVTNPSQLISTFRSITTTLGRALFAIATVAVTITFAYLFGALKMGGEFDMTKWDYSDPRLYHGILDAYVTASFTMVMVRNIPNTIKSLGRKIETGLDRLAETEVFFRAKQLMRGGDWSTKLSNARFFMAANAKAIGDLQRGIIPIAFYTFIVTLRMVDAYETSSIPGFAVFLQILSTARMTKGFTNRVVKPLIPKGVDAPLAQKLIAPETSDMDWFGYMLEDLREDVQEYLKYGHGNGNILMERLKALHTDALEEIELHEANLALDNLFQRENLLGANPTVAESGIGQVQQNIAL
uniref:Uncharacterized protein n=1 Tax=Anopheles melas TaxID=34690 RepID=A0A182TPG8_9DIPT